MFLWPKDRETLRGLRADVDAHSRRLDGLNIWLDDAESLYEKMRTLQARLSKRDQRATGQEPEPTTSQGVATQMKPLALALLQQGYNGGER